MALTQVTGPYPIFTDLDGTPLDDGYLYIGDVNQDPETNPIQVFWDANLTIAAAQPIRTSNGYAYRNGTPALLYTGGEFSITIRNKREEFVLYSPVGYGFDPAAVSASVVKNDFVGDGVEVDFTLSASPNTILATNAFINGVYQEKDSYTLSGNTITFSIAPPLNSSIEILSNQTGVINSGNATDITYTLTAIGAVQQTVQDKLEQYVSVEDFGAVGDGVTDDRAAFIAARNALTALAGRAGGTIYLNQGKKYNLPGGVALASGIVIKGLDSLPLSPVVDFATIPHIINNTASPTFTYVTPDPNDDRYVCPSILGVCIVADNGVDFGFDDNIVTYFMSNGFIRNCVFFPYSAKGETAIRMIENYRGGIENNWIQNFEAGIIQKAGDITFVKRNRIWDCDVMVACLSPTSTGTQTIIEHNDFLKATTKTAHPVFGVSCVLYTQDRWCVFRDNYIEPTWNNDGTAGTVSMDTVVKTVTGGSRGMLIDINNNRIDAHSGQITSRWDFSAEIPDIVILKGNGSFKSAIAPGTQGPLAKIIWPTTLYINAASNTPQRRIFWDESLVIGGDVSQYPPMQSRLASGDFAIDAGSATVPSNLNNTATDVFAQDNWIGIKYTTQGFRERYFWHEMVYDTPGAAWWDVEIEYYGTPGVSVDVQIRNNTSYASSLNLTMAAATQVKKLYGLQRTNMTFDVVGDNTTNFGDSFFLVNIAPSNYRTGTTTYDAPNILASGTTTTTVTVTGAALGDAVEDVSFGVSLQGLVLTSYVSAADTVTLVLFNPTVGAINLASTTVNVRVRKA